MDLTWFYTSFPLSTNWVSLCRGLLAIMSMIVFIVLLRVKVRECPNQTIRHAILLGRFGTITLSIAYWLFVFGHVPAPGAPGSSLTPALLLAYIGQAALLTSVGFAGKNSYWRYDRVEARKINNIVRQK